MSVREYIGARYVPLFADPLTWDATRTYEPLTVVLYQGNSYTSRQAVPANIDISNTTYWAQTGNYNAQIEQYRAEVQTFDGRITQNTDDISDEKTARQNADTALGTRITNETAALQTSIGNEATARQNADAALGTRITNEETARQNADTALGTRITNEETARQNADSELSTLIENVSAAQTEMDAKFSLAYEFANMDNTLVPKYVGDFLANEQFGACAKVNNIIYTICSISYDNSGTLRAFSLDTNSKTIEKTIQVGHANSMAYDSVRNSFWIAPHYTYSQGAGTLTTFLYKYDAAFSAYERKQVPNDNLIFAVTFDHVTKILYAFGLTSTNELACYSMGENENNFTLAWSKPRPNYELLANESQLQDVAVYGNVGMLVKPEGTTYMFNVADGTVIKTLSICAFDVTLKWSFGEVEGVEFDSDGTLYNARNNQVGMTMPNERYGINNAFVTALNMGKKTPINAFSRNAPYPSVGITATSINAFRLGNGLIRTLNQVNFMLFNPSTVSIPAGETVNEEFGQIRLPAGHNLCIEVSGSYTIRHIEMTGGDYAIFVNGGTLNITDPSYAITIAASRTANFKLRDRGTINYNGGQFIHQTYSPSLICIMSSSRDIIVGGKTITAGKACVMFSTFVVSES